MNEIKIFIKKIMRNPFGILLRFELDGSWAYNTDFGEAVKSTFQYGRQFVFPTRNP